MWSVHWTQKIKNSQSKSVINLLKVFRTTVQLKSRKTYWNNIIVVSNFTWNLISFIFLSISVPVVQYSVSINCIIYVRNPKNTRFYNFSRSEQIYLMCLSSCQTRKSSFTSVQNYDLWVVIIEILTQNIYYWSVSVTDRKWTGVDNDWIIFLTLLLLKNRTS